jgi:hypothetical protein
MNARGVAPSDHDFQLPMRVQFLAVITKPCELDSCAQAEQVADLLRPCVSSKVMVERNDSSLRRKLLAVLQYTALEGRVPLDLFDRCAALCSSLPCQSAPSGDTRVV